MENYIKPVNLSNPIIKNKIKSTVDLTPTWHSYKPLSWKSTVYLWLFQGKKKGAENLNFSVYVIRVL